MSSLETIPIRRPEIFRFTSQPRLEKPSLIVGWMKDVGDVSRGVADFLAHAAGGRSFCQIEPTDFFAVGGVTVESNIATFPQSRFFHDDHSKLLLLRSDEPQSRRYEFLSAVLDLAECFKVESVYTVNGIASMIPHTFDRRVFGVFNSVEVQRKLKWHLPIGLRWQGTPHMSTYLLWLAGRRGLQAAGLWLEVPFYLSDRQDAQAIRSAVLLLSRILGWHYETEELDQRVKEQEEMLANLRQEDIEIDARIQRLEQGESLESHEQVELIEAIRGAFRRHG
ncbi:MAG TPA: PAC2 family protein [Sedimentisphaerales bacterium]|nr:PAC2 family protein [Sedimentisphaerales bacterium]